MYGLEDGERTNDESEGMSGNWLWYRTTINGATTLRTRGYFYISSCYVGRTVRLVPFAVHIFRFHQLDIKRHFIRFEAMSEFSHNW